MPATLYVLPDVSAALRQRNPVQTPATLKKAYDGLARWAKPSMRWMTETDKMDKVPMQGGREQNWIVRGVRFMPAHDLLAFFYDRTTQSWDTDLLKKFDISAQDIQAAPNMCPAASKGCMAVCLVDAGQLGLPASRQAQIKRQITFIKDRQAFLTVIAAGISKIVAQGRKAEAKVGIRLNVTSDLPWETYALDVPADFAKYLSAQTGKRIRPGRYRNLMELFSSSVLFYDYTKLRGRMNLFLQGAMPSNYYLTWSLTENPGNRRMALKVLATGKANVAVAFDIAALGDKKPLPRTLGIRAGGAVYRFPVVDADVHDVRPLDGGGVWAGLRFKIPKPKKGQASGMSTIEKMRRAGAFVVKTRGSRDPTISIRGD